MRRSVVRLFATIACFIALPAVAQAQGPGTPADPKAVAAAEHLLDAMNYDRVADQTIDAMIADAQKTLPARLEEGSKTPLPPELKTKISEAIVAWVRNSTAENRAGMRRACALLYARYFTAAELNHLAELQKDPVLIKMQTRMPEIMTETMRLSQAAVARDMPKLRARLQSIIEDYARSNGEKPAT
jgi:hypothetical protein